ncbi:MAG: type II toxin-antitoxin system VapC family toxin [Acidobacteria bacterium]|nr:type II toxin-antitoxin system VapC family toxin [Acidobacteriota bacterium]
MKDTLVDSSVLFDILLKDEMWYEWSATALESVAEESALIVNPIIFAEISASFLKLEDLEKVLPLDLYKREPLPYNAAFLAGRAFVKYKRRGGSKTSPMPDFYIGAHAEVANLRVLTRDPRRFRMYFPKVELITP